MLLSRALRITATDIGITMSVAVFLYHLLRCIYSFSYKVKFIYCILRKDLLIRVESEFFMKVIGQRDSCISWYIASSFTKCKAVFVQTCLEFIPMAC